MSEALVQRVRDCRLRLTGAPWGFAQENAVEIARHWSRRLADNPSFFNGRVLVLERYDLRGGVLDARFMETDFANFLYWKDMGYPRAGAIDGFGSALIRACGGEVLLARQTAGHLNAGLTYMPGGFIDPRDVLADGTVDIDASVVRELVEETGLSAAHFDRPPGYLVTILPFQVSIAVEFVSRLAADELRQLLVSELGRQSDPELEDFVIFRRAPAMEEGNVAEFSLHALAAVFEEAT